jgi:ABC-type dipeptide/oligopeptide/nickel transport system ATPase component
VLGIYGVEIVEQGPVEKFFADPQHLHTQTPLAAVPPDESGAMWPLLQANESLIHGRATLQP